MPRLQIDSESWPELSRLLDAALELTPAERERWLDSLEHCAAPLKAQLQALLANAARVETHDFLNALPLIGVDESELDGDTRARAQSGDCFGPYRLVRELGAGGMGEVWLAERADGLIPRPVALKLPHGASRQAGLAERMAREREILAALSHPNIAQLYDAGVTVEGQPYLALEYIEGKPIDVYCEERRLDVRARVLLFLQVARAVSYAHAKLVVHRDIKPANILVTAAGDTRLLDFGIAKLLDPGHGASTRATEIWNIALTPDYASPEQIAGESVTTSSDVYSLGVVFYELLTAARPYRLERKSRAALEEAILNADPRRPSEVAPDPAARKLLRGDLDTIVLKALKKTVADRYATVNALAEDVERHLTNRPVLAQPDSRAYRYAKFVRRNKLAVGAAAAVLAAIVAGASAAAWQARLAFAEQRRAEDVTEFLASMFRDADPYNGSGQALSAADLLHQAHQRVDAIGARPALRVQLLTLIGSSLLSLEDFDAAESAASEALDLALSALGPAHPQTIGARVLMIGVHRFRGRTDAMRSELEEVEKILRERDDVGDDVSAAERVVVLESRGHLAIDDGDGNQAVASASEAFELARASFGESDARTASAATLLAEAYEYSDVTADDALAAAERAFRLTAAVHGADSAHPRMIIVRDVYGRALARAGKLEEGIGQLERALRDATAVFGDARSTVGFVAENLARYQRVQGDIKAAIANLDRALAIHLKHAQRESFTYLSPLTARGIALLSARLGARALEDLTESSQGLRQLFGPEHEETLIAEYQRALALAYQGRSRESQEAFAPVLEQYRTRYSDPVYLPARPLNAAGTALRLAGDPTGGRALQEEALATIAPGNRLRIGALTELGLDDLELGDPQQAASFLEEARTLQLAAPRIPSPADADVLVGLGRAYLALGDAERAFEPLRAADAFWREFDAGNRWAGEAALWLGRCELALERPAEARATLERAAAILTSSTLPTDAALLELARRP